MKKFKINVLIEKKCTCPSNLRALPDTNGLLSSTHVSFIRYLVITLSVQSKITSNVTTNEKYELTIDLDKFFKLIF
jgi:hypothetical protein